MLKSPIFYAIPFFFLLMGIEVFPLAYRKKKELYRLNDTITNISLGIGSQLSGVLQQRSDSRLVCIYQRAFMPSSNCL